MITMAKGAGCGGSWPMGKDGGKGKMSDKADPSMGPLPAIKATPELFAEVEAFIAENQLEDEKAGKVLREVAPAVQRYVLDLGSLDGCRSRSAGCMGRIAKAQAQGVSNGPAMEVSGAVVAA